LNLGQFRTALDRLTGTSADTTAQTEWINFALNELSLEDRWPWLEKTTTVSLVNGTASYALPTDVRTVTVVFDANANVYDEASIRDLVTFQQVGDDIPAQFGEGYFYSTDGLNIYVSPTPSASGTLTVKYVANETALAGDSDTPLLPAVYHEAVVQLAALKIGQRRMGGSDDTRRIDLYQRTYNRLIGKMKREALRRTGGVRTPRIRPGAAW